MTTTRTLRPSEYTQLWKEQNLDAYLEGLAGLRGERRCLNCFAGELLKLGIDVAERTVSRLMPKRCPEPSQT